MFTVLVNNAEQTRAVGAALATVVRGGDLIMLTGDLGTGKTTLTQGLGQAMGVRGRVASPTFIIARVHPNSDGPDLVHVDAYRIGDLDDLETLDLDTSLPESVVVVEWGDGKTEALSEDRLHITLELEGAQDTSGADLSQIDSGARRLTFRGFGSRWMDEDGLRAVVDKAVEAAQ